MKPSDRAASLSRLLALHERTLEGAFPIVELHSSYPNAEELQEPLRSIWMDLEEAVEHVPGHPLGDVDKEAWARTFDYKRTLWRQLCLRAAIDSDLSDQQISRLMEPADLNLLEVDGIPLAFEAALDTIRG